MPLPIIPYDGRTGRMDITILNLAGGNNSAMVHLFQNSFTPDLNSVVADFTESTWAGYSALPTPPATDNGIDGGGRDIWVFDPLTFGPATGMPSEVVYGYWIDYLDPLTATVRLDSFQLFDIPIAISLAGQTVGFTLSWSGNQGA